MQELVMIVAFVGCAIVAYLCGRHRRRRDDVNQLGRFYEKQNRDRQTNEPEIYICGWLQVNGSEPMFMVFTRHDFEQTWLRGRRNTEEARGRLDRKNVRI